MNDEAQCAHPPGPLDQDVWRYLRVALFMAGLIVLQGILVVVCVEAGIAIRAALNTAPARDEASWLKVYVILAAVCIVLGAIVSIRAERLMAVTHRKGLLDRTLTVVWHATMNIVAYVIANGLLLLPFWRGRF